MPDSRSVYLCSPSFPGKTDEMARAGTIITPDYDAIFTGRP